METIKIVGTVILWAITFGGIVALAYYMWKDRNFDM